MTVTVRYFASARELAGTGSMEFPVAADETVACIWDKIIGETPSIKNMQATIRYAVNGALSGLDTPVRDGDEVALLPPVSGG